MAIAKTGVKPLKATPEEIRADWQKSAVWFALGFMVALFLVIIFGY
jgi:hypothetical protein